MPQVASGGNSSSEILIELPLLLPLLRGKIVSLGWSLLALSNCLKQLSIDENQQVFHAYFRTVL